MTELKNAQPIVVEQAYSAAPERVWVAITNPGEMQKWFFPQITEFKPEPEFETKFDVVNGDKTYPHRWKVFAVDENKRLLLTWKYDGFAGDSIVEFLITPENGGSKLKVTHKGFETFPQDDPSFARESGLAGWKYFINESLTKYLS